MRQYFRSTSRGCCQASGKSTNTVQGDNMQSGSPLNGSPSKSAVSGLGASSPENPEKNPQHKNTTAKEASQKNATKMQQLPQPTGAPTSPIIRSVLPDASDRLPVTGPMSNPANTVSTRYFAIPSSSDTHTLVCSVRSNPEAQLVDPPAPPPMVLPATASLKGNQVDCKTSKMPSIDASREATLQHMSRQPTNDIPHPIAPRRPGALNVGLRSTVNHRAPRAKRRRLTGAGKRWATAVDKFVHQIPPVPYFSDPRRLAPMRDMRGWIAIINRPTQNLAWQRFMRELKQEDLDDNGDHAICRHILSSVVHEAQDPTSERRQTRQAVNNAIKRELGLPKASGQTGRGETFRELFREKAISSGFRLTPPETSGEKEELHLIDDDVVMYDRAGATNASRSNSSMLSGSRMAIANSLVHVQGNIPDTRVSPDTARMNLLATVGYSASAMSKGTGWNQVESRCKRTAAGEAAWWSSPDLKTPEQMSALCTHLVRTTNIAELKRILVDFRWVRRHASSGADGVMQLVMKGYDALLAIKTEALSWFEREGYRLVRNALMLINPILRPELELDSVKMEADNQSFCAHLASQLYGRLLTSSQRFSVILALLESIRTHVQPPWLRPLSPCFDAPKTDIAIAVKSGSNSLASAVAISADGEFVVTPGDNYDEKKTVRVWDVGTGNCITIITACEFLWPLLAITPDKRVVITSSTANGNGPLMFWNILDEKRRYIREVKEETAITAFGEKDTIFAVVVLPNSKSVIGASEGKIRMWSVDSGERERVFKAVGGTIYDLDITPDGALLCAGIASGAVGIWNVANGERLLVIKNEEVGSSIPRVLKGDTELKIDEIDAERLYCVSFMVDRVQKSGAPKTVKSIKVVCGGAEKVRIWNISDPRSVSPSENFEYEHMKTIPFPGFGIINNIRCTDEQTMYFASGDGNVRTYKLKDEHKDDKRCIPTILGCGTFALTGRRSESGIKSAPVFISVSDNGQRVATGTDRPFMLVWDVGQYEETLKENSVMFNQSLDPWNMPSFGFMDMLRNYLLNMAKNWQPSKNPKRELRVLKQNRKENVLKLQILPSTDVHSLVFDRKIEHDVCRVGVFSMTEETMIEEAEIATIREGVSVQFSDETIGLFEAERGITQLGG